MAVVALRALGLGDLLTAVPALRALHRAFPTARLVLAAPAWQWPIAQACGVDEIVDVDGRGALDSSAVTAAIQAWSAARCEPVDVAVNLHGRGPESTRALAALGPDRLVTYPHPDAPPPERSVAWMPGEHEVARWCRLLSQHGIPADPADLAIDVPPDTDPLVGPDTVIVHPGAAAPARRWPIDRFATVARRLLDAGHAVAYTGSLPEVPLCEAVRGAAGGGVVLAGRTGLASLVATVDAARAVLTNDTGVAHLASACATPSVVLFGPEPPSRWGPPAMPYHRALWAGRCGNPHATDLDPGLASITVDEVVAALEDVLAAIAAPTQSAVISPGAE